MHICNFHMSSLTLHLSRYTQLGEIGDLDDEAVELSIPKHTDMLPTGPTGAHHVFEQP